MLTTENPKTKRDVPVGTTNIVKEVSDEERAWAAEELDCDKTCMELDWFDEAIVADYANMPDLQKVSHSEDEEKWTDEKLEDGNGLRFEEVEKRDEAFSMRESMQTTRTTELYDSGCTNHISPY